MSVTDDDENRNTFSSIEGAGLSPGMATILKMPSYLPSTNKRATNTRITHIDHPIFVYS